MYCTAFAHSASVVVWNVVQDPLFSAIVPLRSRSRCSVSHTISPPYQLTGQPVQPFIQAS